MKRKLEKILEATIFLIVLISPLIPGVIVFLIAPRPLKHNVWLWLLIFVLMELLWIMFWAFCHVAARADEKMEEMKERIKEMSERIEDVEKREKIER